MPCGRRPGAGRNRRHTNNKRGWVGLLALLILLCQFGQVSAAQKVNEALPMMVVSADAGKDKVMAYAGVDKAAIGNGFDANTWVKAALTACNGKGGAPVSPALAAYSARQAAAALGLAKINGKLVREDRRKGERRRTRR